MVALILQGGVRKFEVHGKQMKQVYVKTRAAWRSWLVCNHDTSSGIWLVFYRKQTGKPTLDYDEAVEEALCFGWIDSIIKKIDDERYVRKLTPQAEQSMVGAEQEAGQEACSTGADGRIGACRGQSGEGIGALE